MDHVQETLRQSHPQQNDFEFDKIRVSSKFDSGNLASCTLVTKNVFHLTISEDSKPYSTAGHYRTWFYFSVTGVPQGETLTFSMRNMNNQGKLYKAGLKPVFRVLPTHQKSWKRIPTAVTFDYGSDGFSIQWQFAFNCDPSETAFFAFHYPYSFQESLQKSQGMADRLEGHSSIYFHREILSYSIE